MKRRSIFAIAVTSLTVLFLLANPGVAQEAADIEAVKAANQAFYAALSGRDAKAMEAVWANTHYVVNIGPRSKAIAIGHADAVLNYWPKAFETFSEIDVTLTSAPHLQIHGPKAVVIGTEKAVLKLASDGKTVEFDVFVTNTFEKIDGQWLMVSHHAGIIPK